MFDAFAWMTQTLLGPYTAGSLVLCPSRWNASNPKDRAVGKDRIGPPPQQDLGTNVVHYALGQSEKSALDRSD